MQLSQQVCSLELSRKLKELGVKQESLFWWGRTWGECHNATLNVVPSPGQYEIIQEKNHAQELWGDGSYSAFTVAELGEMLPGAIETKNAGYANSNHPNLGMRDAYYILQCGRNDPLSDVKYFDVDYSDKTQPKDVLRLHSIVEDITEANARAKMMIYLLENGLIKE